MFQMIDMCRSASVLPLESYLNWKSIHSKGLVVSYTDIAGHKIRTKKTLFCVDSNLNPQLLIIKALALEPQCSRAGLGALTQHFEDHINPVHIERMLSRTKKSGLQSVAYIGPRYRLYIHSKAL